MSNVYFMYSSDQYKIRAEANKRLGKQYKPGTVMINGKMKQYTEIVTDPSKATYCDAIVVASGPKDRMKFTRGN